MTINDFFTSHNNKSWDKYGKENRTGQTQWYEPYGGQCVSLIKAYLIELFGNRVKASYGNAIDFWTGRSSNGILELCDEVEDFQNGDIVVSAGSMPEYGHIWIYLNGQAFSQNVLSDPAARLYPISWQGGIYGILRPKVQKPEAKPEPIEYKGEGSVYRLYNPGNGDHLYTLSHDEAVLCQDQGWKYEGIGWKSPDSGELVMRLCNPTSGQHHYTADQDEIKSLQDFGWSLEGAAFWSSGSRTIWRMYNPNGGEHILTADRAEHNELTKAGWECEGQPLRW